jgi:hypothetical protein
VLQGTACSCPPVGYCSVQGAPWGVIAGDGWLQSRFNICRKAGIDLVMIIELSAEAYHIYWGANYNDTNER